MLMPFMDEKGALKDPYAPIDENVRKVRANIFEEPRPNTRARAREQVSKRACITSRSECIDTAAACTCSSMYQMSTDAP